MSDFELGLLILGLGIWASVTYLVRYWLATRRFEARRRDK